jgi:hypothetical protein
MGEEKTEVVVEKNRHTFVRGGGFAALLSLLFLVPVLRKFRAQQHHKARRHFPILGH